MARYTFRLVHCTVCSNSYCLGHILTDSALPHGHWCCSSLTWRWQVPSSECSSTIPFRAAVTVAFIVICREMLNKCLRLHSFLWLVYIYIHIYICICDCFRLPMLFSRSLCLVCLHAHTRADTATPTRTIYISIKMLFRCMYDVWLRRAAGNKSIYSNIRCDAI